MSSSAFLLNPADVRSALRGGLLLVAVAVGLLGCAPAAKRHHFPQPSPAESESPARREAPAQSAPSVDVQKLTPRSESPASSVIVPSRRPSHPAVAALVKEAEACSARGQPEAGAAAIERAIRIKPRDPFLWQQLARLKLQQHQADAAEDFAKRSNSLAKGDGGLVRENWGLIAQARRLKGDAQGATEADSRAGN